MSGFANAVVGGLSKLIRPAIQSPNYVSTVSGWTVNKNGTAEFNSLTVRNGVVISSLSLFYSGTPAFGNLIASIGITAGTDSFGNAYIGGNVEYSPATGGGQQAMQYLSDGLRRYTAPTQAGPYGLDSSVLLDNTGFHVNNAISIFQGKITAILGTPVNPHLFITDTWNNLVPVVTGYAVSLCRYRLTIENTCRFQIQARAGVGGGTAGTYNVTTGLPVQYQPPGALALTMPLGYNGTLAAGANSGSLLIDEASSVNAGRIRVQVPGLPVNSDIGCVVEWPLD